MNSDEKNIIANFNAEISYSSVSTIEINEIVNKKIRENSQYSNESQ